ncbi:MAG: hypothetical protein PWQ97_492 [Tepidanaerobacteraceae bacterium]|nr:hypothetical protein [Tepidanaerobacteraceae bacterium]
MTRVIALEEGLEDIGEYLRKKGYTTVLWGNSHVAADAVVYKSRKLDDINTAIFNRAVAPLLDETGNENSYGVLLVNAQDMTPEEVYEIIKSRVYERFI